jgi:hypothetical protein
VTLHDLSIIGSLVSLGCRSTLVAALFLANVFGSNSQNGTCACAAAVNMREYTLFRISLSAVCAACLKYE